MDPRTFLYNFKNHSSATGRHKTYLCYKVEVMNNFSRKPVNSVKGFLLNQEVAAFLQGNRHVRLSIFVARLYDIEEGYEDGLCSLYNAGAHLAVMTFKEFEYCWRTFVDNQQCPFWPWAGLKTNSEFMSRRLQCILL